jgi:MFS family permease
MYQVWGWLDLFRSDRPEVAGARERRIPANVLFLGLTSLFTDISSEMVVSVLPIYLVGFLRMSPVQFGIVDGLYQGAAGLVQLASAVFTDRIRRYKEMAAVGYGASALCRIGLLATTGWASITAILAVDRLGKGMRSAPRDALISLSVPQDRLATAFGVHRAMDAVGAMLGPILAFVILRVIAGGFDVVFAASLSIGVVGFAVLWLFVENRTPASLPGDTGQGRPSVGRALGLLARPAFRHLAIAALLLGSMTISDGFVYLTLQRRVDMSAGAFPLLYVLTSTGYLVFAIPAGRLADRLGRFPIFLAGHGMLVVLYSAILAGGRGFGVVVLAVVMMGLYYACTEGVLMAMGSALLPEDIRTSGLAVITTLLAVARFSGSAVFGLVWTRIGLSAAVASFMGGLVLAIVVVTAIRPRGATA